MQRRLSNIKLKRLFFMLGGLALIVFLIIAGLALMRPDYYHLERTIVIAAPAEKVFSHIDEIQEWELWSSWKVSDPTIQYSYEGPPSGVGARQNWTSSEYGTGHLTFTAVVSEQKVAYQIFYKELAFQNDGAILLTPVDAGTRVTRTMDGHHNVVEKLCWVLFNGDATEGRKFKKSLELLKQVVEKN